METPVKRHPDIPLLRLPLTEQDASRQIKKGLFVTERGEPFALPVDSLGDRTVFKGRKLWTADDGWVHRPGARRDPMRYSREDLPEHLKPIFDSLSKDDIGHLYRSAVGHDMHLSMQGNLYVRHWHRGWANPLTGEVRRIVDPTVQALINTHWAPDHIICRLGVRCPAIIWPSAKACIDAHSNLMGWMEEVGWVSGGKVTTAFRGEIIDELVSSVGSEFADFDHHEVGTGSTAESNADTALGTSTGIARVAGTPTDADPIYRSVGTITADASETWAEHGLFNNTTGAALMDRSLTGGQAVVSSDQVQYTYELTVNAEA